MIPFPYKILGAAVIVFSVALGSYLKGRSDVNEKWDAAKLVAQAAYDAAVADKLQTEKTWKAKQKESVDAIQAKLKASDARADDLANRLRNYFAGSGPLSDSPGTAPGSPGTSSLGSDESAADARVRAALADHLEACEIDGLWLNWWIERNALREAQ